MEEKEDYGSLTAGAGSDKERKIKIIGHVVVDLDDRTIALSELENEEGYALLCTGKENSGLSDQDIWISEVSLHGILSVIMGLMAVKGVTPDASLDMMLKAGMKNVQITDNYKIPEK